MNDYLSLLQGYYKYLLLGKFFEHQAQTQLLGLEENLQIETGDHTKFTLRASQIASLLADMHQYPDAKNVFGYLTEVSAFRGIFSIMREMIEKLPTFRWMLQEMFGDQYFAFEQVIRFLRNVLSHSTTPSILIQLADFQKQQEFLLSKKVKKIRLHFVYANHLEEWEGSPTYACDISLDLFTLRPLSPLMSVVSVHQMYLLSELCFNVSKIIAGRVTQQKKKTAKK